MFKLCDFSGEVEKSVILQEMKSRIEALAGHIELIRSLEVGINVRGLSYAYDLVLVMNFDSLMDVEAYTIHPAHQDFVQWNSDKSEMKALIDFRI